MAIGLLMASSNRHMETKTDAPDRLKSGTFEAVGNIAITAGGKYYTFPMKYVDIVALSQHHLSLYASDNIYGSSVELQLSSDEFPLSIGNYSIPRGNATITFVDHQLNIYSAGTLENSAVAKGNVTINSLTSNSIRGSFTGVLSSEQNDTPETIAHGVFNCIFY